MRQIYMIHEMKLNESPFERIKNGTKTIEFRLYDEKRRKVKRITNYKVSSSFLYCRKNQKL